MFFAVTSCLIQKYLATTITTNQIISESLYILSVPLKVKYVKLWYIPLLLHYNILQISVRVGFVIFVRDARKLGRARSLSLSCDQCWSVTKFKFQMSQTLAADECSVSRVPWLLIRQITDAALRSLQNTEYKTRFDVIF